MSLKIILCHFCEAHGPRVLFCSETKSLAQINVAATQSPGGSSHQGGGMCVACTSVSDHPGFVSKDSFKPTGGSVGENFDPLVYKSSQYPDSADDFSHVRQACLKSLSNEVGVGQKSCIFFGDTKNGYTLSQVFNLHDSKARGLQRLYSLLAWSRDRYFLVNYWAFFEENFNIVIEGLVKKAEQVFNSESKHTTAASKTFQRTRAVTARSLATLVNCEDVFERLHKQFAWILKNSFSFFVEVPIPDWVRVTDHDSEVATEVSKDLISDEFLRTSLETVQEDPLTTSSKILLPLRALYQLLGGSYFVIVCLHTLIGNQVIVRGTNQEFVTAILNTFAKLIPLGCCRIKTESKQYFEAFQYNFLGLKENVEIPSHVLESDLFVLLDVIGDGQELNLYKFEVTSNFYFERENMPNILVNLEKILTNTHDFSSVEVISYYLCMKEDLIGKAETLYQFTKFSDCRNYKSKMQTCFKMLEANTELEQMMLRFWVNGLSNKFKKNQMIYLKEFESS